MGTDQLFIAVDLGTNGNKVAIVDAHGNLRYSRYFETTITYPAPGRVEQDPEEYVRVAMSGIRSILAESSLLGKDITAVGFTGQMGGIIGVDKDFQIITGYDSALDSQCKQYEKLLIDKYGPLLFSKSSGAATHGTKISWWKKERTETYDKVFAFMPLSSYVTARCCALSIDQAFYDYSNLSFTGLYSIPDQRWSEDLCVAFNVDKEKLPRIVRPWDIVGTISSAAASLSGLLQGTPVIAGAGDQPAGFLGAGVVEPGDAISVAGSTSVFSLCTDKFIPDTATQQILYMNSVFTDRFYPLSYVSGGGIDFRWFRDTIAKDEANKAAIAGIDVFSVLDTEARAIKPGAEGLVFIPHFSGRACPASTCMAGAWLGLRWGHGIPHLYRAMLESIAYDHRIAFNRMCELFGDILPHWIVVTGGGAKSHLWNEIKADVCGLPFHHIDRTEVGLSGIALICAHAVGIISDLRLAAKEYAHSTTSIEPNIATNEIYSHMLARYQEALACMDSWCAKTM